MNIKEIRALCATTPFVDAHAHLVHPSIYALMGVEEADKKPTLAQKLLCLTCRPTFLAAGMEAKQIEGILAGEIFGKEAKAAVLQFLPYVDKTSAVQATTCGIFAFGDMAAELITEQNYDALESCLVEPSYGNWQKCAKKFNIKHILLNMWAGHEAAYFCTQNNDGLSKAEQTAKEELFTHIPTIDAHALNPSSKSTAKLAAHLGCALDTLDEYESFLRKLLDYLVTYYDIGGIKVNEQYFRSLDYKYVPRERAEDIYKSGSDFYERELCDYIAYFIFPLAEKHNLTVQLHTGMLWNNPDTSNLSPNDLCRAIAHFGNVRFDLLHLGFPYVEQAAAMAANAHNVMLNLAWAPLISESMTRDWLVRIIEIVPLNKISFGTDVFDIESLCGTAEIIRDIVAHAATAFPGRERLIAESLLHKNAERLYGL